ncbi:MAG: hypothetical protein HRO68_10230 [Nitrosopumilus sp.]|nr:hypothetical protein [Nitrosopumilus sp.]
MNEVKINNTDIQISGISPEIVHSTMNGFGEELSHQIINNIETGNTKFDKLENIDVEKLSVTSQIDSTILRKKIINSIIDSTIKNSHSKKESNHND